MSIYLSVIVPCYNEELRFKRGFKHYFSYLKKQKYSWELLFVNDGSYDKTEELLKNSVKINKNVKMISYSKNKGKGYAIVKGVEKALGRYILFSDIDHSVPISTIESFFNSFERGYDVVIGSRRVIGAKFLKRQPFLREFLGRGFSALVRLLIDFKITDTTCGFKAFKNEFAKKIFQKITVYGWVFDAEIIFLCKKYGLKVSQVPVVWEDVRGSKVSVGRDIVGSLFGLLKVRINDIQNKY